MTELRNNEHKNIRFFSVWCTPLPIIIILLVWRNNKENTIFYNENTKLRCINNEVTDPDHWLALRTRLVNLDSTQISREHCRPWLRHNPELLKD